MPGIRQILSSAYSYVRSQETNQSTSAITLDHLIQSRIDSIKKGAVTQITNSQGDSIGDKPSRYDVLANIQSSMDLLAKALENAGNDPDKLAVLGLEQENG